MITKIAFVKKPKVFLVIINQICFRQKKKKKKDNSNLNEWTSVLGNPIKKKKKKTIINKKRK